MVFRPVLWLGLAYITGEILALNLSAARGFLIFAAATLVILLIFTGWLDPPLLFGDQDTQASEAPGAAPKMRYKNHVLLLVLPVFLCLGLVNTHGALAAARADDARLGAAFGKNGGQTEFLTQVDRVEEKDKGWYVYGERCEGLPVSGLLIYVKKSHEKRCPCAVGDWIYVRGEGELFLPPANAGGFDEWLYYHSRHVGGRVWADQVTVYKKAADPFTRLAGKVKAYMRENFIKYLDSESAGVAASMVLGDKALMDSKLTKLYRENGIAHILAISGLHISFMGMGIYKLLKRLFVPERICAAAGIGLVLVYGSFTGMAPSTLRAVIMTGLSLGAKLLGRTYDRLTALALAALITLVPSPLLLTQPGFYLSYGAALSLALCKKGSRLASVYITVGMLPLTAWAFFEIPLYSMLINALVIPFMGILYPSMAACGLLGGLLGDSGFILYGMIEGVLAIYQYLCELFDRLPGALVIVGQPSVFEMLLIYTLMLAALYFLRGYTLRLPGGRPCLWGGHIPVRLAAILGMIFAVFMIFIPRRPSQMTVTMVDVGQGDCFLIQLPTGENLLVDCGSSDVSEVGRYVIAPFLKCRGVRRIHTVFLSHLDSDHCNGLEYLLRESGLDMESLVMSFEAMAEEEGKQIQRMAEVLGVSCISMAAGESLAFGSLLVQTVWPGTVPGGVTDAAGTNANDQSLVLHMRYGSFDMLFTGDVGSGIEAGLMENLRLLGLTDCDVLKVPHHGSKHSASEKFLAFISPEAALISYGAGNSYGHPHEELLRRLSARKCMVRATGGGGQLTLKTDGKQMVFQRSNESYEK